MPSREGEELCSELRPPVGGTPRSRGEAPDLAVICRALDEIKVSRNDGKQVVEVMGNTTRELSDGLHLLALMKLLLDALARLHGMPVLGDVSKEDRESLRPKETR